MNRNQYREEIANYLKRLSRYVDVALNHILYDGIHLQTILLKDFLKLLYLVAMKENS